MNNQMATIPSETTVASTEITPVITTAAADDREKVISLLDCEDYEAAFVLVNGEIVFRGNYWDFHSGCFGTNIAGEELSGVWDSGIISLTGALAARFREKGYRVVQETIPISDEQYDLI